MNAPLDADVDRLARAAARHAASDAPARAALALRTARAVAAVAERWTHAAVAMKLVPDREDPVDAAATATPAVGAAAVHAEEAATGPMATLRLLLLTARSFASIARHGRPVVAGGPRVLHPAGGTGPASFVAVDVLPAPNMMDSAIFQGHAATVRCVNPGGLAVFDRAWREEVITRPRGGGVAVVLGAGNVTGLPVADACSQIFEHGRVVLLKLHPRHAPLEPILREALGPLVSADVLAITTGGAERAREAVDDPRVTHVHLTGSRGAFDALVWGGPGPHPPSASPRLAKPLTCELGNVTPWFVVPGGYTPEELAFQADLVAGSVVNNTSFNCIATKCVVTSREWDQRDEFLAALTRRIESQPARPAWYPGSTASWESLAERSAPTDGTLPWLVRSGLEWGDESPWLAREWFVPAVVEVALPADSIDRFCDLAGELAHRLPGTLAASVTVPRRPAPHDARRIDLFVDHLAYGVVAVNAWSAIAYTFASVPWGGYPGGTLAEPGSGIGHVHDPLLLPLVHNTIVRAPLRTRHTPPWLPWHRHTASLARGVIDLYAALAEGRGGWWQLARMLPAVMRG